MLKQLEISNYALIENLSLSFSPDFTTITGETGAGKSIMLKALGLILGERADTSVIKQNSSKCILEAHFDITSLGLSAFFEQNDIDYDNQSIIRREFAASGKSRAFINDTPVPLSVLSALGKKLVNIHSQNETMLINSTEFQFQILDQFAGINNKVKSYQEVYKEYQARLKERIDLQLKEMENRKERDYLEFLVKELEEANLDNINISDLQQKGDLIENSEKILENLQYANSVLENEEIGPKIALKALLEAFSNLTEYDKKYAEVHSRLMSIKIELDDIDNEIGGMIGDLSIDEEEAQIVKEKLESVNSLTFKHNVNDLHGLIQLKSDLELKLSGINDNSERLEELIEITEKLKEEIAKKSKEISVERRKAIPVFEKAVAAKLAEMAMENAELEIAISPVIEPNRFGADNITYLFTANKGAPKNELKKVASGGELSRLMLSFLEISSEVDHLPTMIFDEIDTGVSGEVASKMAAVLKSMGKKLQIISITHLPQVAAAGSEHIYVSKSTNKDKTTTLVEKLNNEERVLAIARMLSGEEISEVAKENAQSLLANN